MSTKINYSGKKVFIGIDVHKKTYSLTIICEEQVCKRLSMPAIPDVLIAFFKNNFAGATIFSAYEAGFAGFCLHRILLANAIQNIVINPASIEVATRDKVKNDKRDSKKIAEHLSQNRIKGIRIPSEDEEQARLLSRIRETFVEHRTQIAVQIKSKLFQFGYIASTDNQIFSKKYIHKIREYSYPNELEFVINNLIESWEHFDKKIDEVENKLKKQGEEDKEIQKVYCSVPGIGDISARLLANELRDMSQFKNEGALFSFVGFTPSEYSSGEDIRRGHISRQGSARIRKVLVECSWRCIQYDQALREIFNRIANRAGKKRAIIAVARRLIGRIRSCFKNHMIYELGRGA